MNVARRARGAGERLDRRAAGRGRVGRRARRGSAPGRGRDGVGAQVDVVEHLGAEALVHLRVEMIELVAARRGASASRARASACKWRSSRRGCTASTPTALASICPRRTRGRCRSDARAVAAAGHAARRVALVPRRRAEGAARRAWRSRNHAHADVQVEALALPYDGFASKLEAAIPRGNGPDLVIFGHGDDRRVGARRAYRAAADDDAAERTLPRWHGRAAARRRQAVGRAARLQEPGAVLPQGSRRPSAGDHRRARRAGEAAEGAQAAGTTRSPTKRARRSITRPGCTASAAASSTTAARPALDSDGAIALGGVRRSARRRGALAAGVDRRRRHAAVQRRPRRAHHQRPLVRRRDRARRALRRGAAADGERDRAAGGAARRDGGADDAGARPRSRRRRRRSRAGSPAPRRPRSAPASAARRWPRARPGTIPTIAARSDPRRPSARSWPRRCRCRRRRRSGRSGSRSTRRCARCCAARPSARAGA